MIFRRPFPRGMRVAVPVLLAPEERQQLLTWSRGRSTPKRLMDRARIVLAAADGKSNKQIAEEFDLDQDSVGLWRRRFALMHLPGIEKDAPRPGRKPRLGVCSPTTIRVQ